MYTFSQLRQVPEGLEILPYYLMTFARLRSQLKRIGEGGPIIAIEARHGEEAVGLALAYVEGNHQRARVLSIFVKEPHRHEGVGTGLLGMLETAAGARGCKDMYLDYRDDLPARKVFEKLLNKCKWTVPELHMTMVEGDKHFVCQSEWMQRKSPLPEGYELFPWGDLTEADRESILGRQASTPWYPESLAPFRDEQIAEPINSLGLRCHGVVIGWMTTHRAGPDKIRYSQLFVSEDVRGLGVGFTLLRESIRLHCESDVDGFYFVFEPSSPISPWVEQLFRERATFHTVLRSTKTLSTY